MGLGSPSYLPTIPFSFSFSYVVYFTDEMGKKEAEAEAETRSGSGSGLYSKGKELFFFLVIRGSSRGPHWEG